MNLSNMKTRQWALVIAAGAVLAGPAMAQATSIRVRVGGARRAWVPPVYQERVTTVWVEPVYEVRVRQVWVPPVYRDRWVQRDLPAVVRTKRVPKYNRRGRVIGSTTIREVLQPARTVREKARVKVRPGYYKEIEERVRVRPGHEQVIRQKVLVREGYYTHRHRPGHGRSKGFSFAFSFGT